MTVTLPLPSPEWDEYTDAWFHRRITRFLREKLGQYLRGADDPDLVEAVADALLARRAEFAHWMDADTFVPDHYNGHWAIDWQAIHKDLDRIATDCEARRSMDKEADAFPTLDAWLAALGRGDVTADPRDLPSVLREPDTLELLPERFQTLTEWREAGAHRQQHWPRLCRSCGREFRPVEHRQGGPQQRRGNATICPECRGAGRRRTARREGRQ